MNEEQERANVQARWKEFWNDHQTFNSPWARNILHSLSEFLGFVFKFEALLPGLKQLYVASGVQFPDDFDWECDWTNMLADLPAANLAVLPIFKCAIALRAYAYYGLVVRKEEIDVFSFLDVLEESFIPRQWGNDDETEQTIHAALGRRKLDYKTLGYKLEGLRPEELAALAELNRKSIMNLIAPGKSGALQKDDNDHITVESASRWLLGRPGFRPSIWHHQDDLSFIPRDASLVVEPLFVPVARDGSWFSPSDRRKRDSLYYVSNGDDEQGFDDYWSAIDFLTRAGSPQWRYTDTAGRWRIKKGTAWERKSRQEVEKLLSGDPNGMQRIEEASNT